MSAFWIAIMGAGVAIFVVFIASRASRRHGGGSDGGFAHGASDGGDSGGDGGGGGD